MRIHEIKLNEETLIRRDKRQQGSIITGIMMVSGSRGMIGRRTDGITGIISRWRRRRGQHSGTLAGVRYYMRRSRAGRLRASNDSGAGSVQMMRPGEAQIDAVSAARGEI